MSSSLMIDPMGSIVISCGPAGIPAVGGCVVRIDPGSHKKGKRGMLKYPSALLPKVFALPESERAETSAAHVEIYVYTTTAPVYAHRLAEV